MTLLMVIKRRVMTGKSEVKGPSLEIAEEKFRTITPIEDAP